MSLRNSLYLYTSLVTLVLINFNFYFQLFLVTQLYIVYRLPSVRTNKEEEEDGGISHWDAAGGVFRFQYCSLWSFLLCLQEETQNCGQTQCKERHIVY